MDQHLYGTSTSLPHLWGQPTYLVRVAGKVHRAEGEAREGHVSAPTQIWGVLWAATVSHSLMRTHTWTARQKEICFRKHQHRKMSTHICTRLGRLRSPCSVVLMFHSQKPYTALYVTYFKGTRNHSDPSPALGGVRVVLIHRGKDSQMCDLPGAEENRKEPRDV